jgi:hypothetical protein
MAERFTKGDAIRWRKLQWRVCEMCAHVLIHHLEDRGGTEVENPIANTGQSCDI